MARPLLVVKLGGSIITEKEQPFTPRLDLLEEYAEVLKKIANVYDLVIVIGGGSYGHYAVRACREAGASPPETLHVVTNAMLELAMLVSEMLASHGLYTIIYPPRAFCKPRGLEPNCEWRRVRDALASGAYPLVFGDAYPIQGEYGIVSGDELSIEAACKLGGQIVVFTTNVPGVIIGGEVVDMLDREKLEYALKTAGGTQGDVTGGMRRKLEAILVNGCPGLRVHIIDGRDPANLEKVVLRGERIGTLVIL
ncbi:aspartate/glutamate/uridylate kinase [Pyrolobus fumarii 1A]|uniref:Isopentenyl phosphate kinase n=1 Tax=Pyrolobus fumarii (strain DSM 11204 / 1A) TaxID=694429 RepID=G0EE90_PYRF1|nr:isopentenyl phosphate kinase [Pyrolobus fumarii]AEM38784.1 aspartate/glutamate/uridylate kinase [Pyrolobus fumarii 1A]